MKIIQRLKADFLPLSSDRSFGHLVLSAGLMCCMLEVLILLAVGYSYFYLPEVFANSVNILKRDWTAHLCLLALGVVFTTFGIHVRRKTAEVE